MSYRHSPGVGSRRPLRRLAAALAGAAVVTTGALTPLATVTSTAASAATTLPTADVLDLNFAGGTAVDEAQGLTVTTAGSPEYSSDAALGGAPIVSFDGGADSLGIDFSQQMSKITPSITIECAIRWDGSLPASGEKSICSMAEAGGYTLGVINNDLAFQVNAAGTYYKTTADITAGEWTHVVGTWDGTTVSLYVNGVLADQTTTSGNWRQPNTSTFRIGADPDWSGNPTKYAPVSVSLARVYSQPVSSDVATALYADFQDSTSGLAEGDILSVSFDDGTSLDAVSGSTGIEYGQPSFAQAPELSDGVAVFDGASSVAYPLQSYFAANTLGELTLSCTFRVDSTLPVGGEKAICSMADAGGFIFSLMSDQIVFQTNTGGTYFGVRSTIEADTWYQVIGVWTGSQLLMYLNGTLVGTTATSGALKVPAEAARVFHVGGDPDGTGALTSGKSAAATVADVQLYSYAISSAQARTAYRNSPVGAAMENTVQVTATAPAEGSTVSTSTVLDVTYNLPQLVATSTVTATLDGVPVQIGDEIAEGLTQGRHTLVISGQDAFGRDFTKTVLFNSTDVAYGEGSKSEVEGTSAILSVVAESPAGGTLRTDFYRTEVSVAGSLTQGSFDAVPSMLDVVAGTEVDGSLNPDGEMTATDATKKIAYQRFDVAATGADDERIVWTGQVNLDREVALLVWDTADEQWVELARADGLGETSVQLTATPAATMLDGGVYHVLVIGEDPFEDNLDSTVTDAFGDPEDYDFSLVHYTDQQNSSENAAAASTAEERAVWAESYESLLQWIVDNKDTYNIAYAAQTGDVIQKWYQQNPNSASDVATARAEYDFASRAQEILDEAEIPYGMLPGNHDNLNATDTGAESMWNDYFGPDRFEALEATAGWQAQSASYTAWQEGDNQNHYDLFTAGGLDFVAVYLGFGVTDEEAAWADGVLKQYADRNAIVFTHAYNGTSVSADGRGASFSADGNRVYSQVVEPNENVFLVLSGHEHGVSLVIRDREGGSHVVEVLGDYQDYLVPAGEVGLDEIAGYDSEQGLRLAASYLRLLQIDVDRSVLKLTTYSPFLDDFGATEYDQLGRYNGSEDQFVVPINLSTRTTTLATDTLAVLGVTDEAIGSAVADSGWPAEVEWSGLEPGAVYGWRALSNAIDTVSVEASVSSFARRSVTTADGVEQLGLFTAGAAADTAAPVITVPALTVTVTAGETFDALAGVSAADDTDGDLTAAIVVSGTWNTAVAGQYVIGYSVTDAAGNTATASVTLVVEPADGGSNDGEDGSGGGTSGSEESDDAEESDDSGSSSGSEAGTGTDGESDSTGAESTAEGSSALPSTGAAGAGALGLAGLALVLGGVLLTRGSRFGRKA